jgi:hypothetical protein
LPKGKEAAGAAIPGDVQGSLRRGVEGDPHDAHGRQRPEGGFSRGLKVKDTSLEKKSIPDPMFVNSFNVLEIQECDSDTSESVSDETLVLETKEPRKRRSKGKVAETPDLKEFIPKMKE